MRVIGNFSVEDYIAHYKNSDDYYHRTCLRRANRLLFQKVRFFVFIVVFTGVFSFLVIYGLNFANEKIEDAKVKADEMMSGMLMIQELSQTNRAELLQGLSGAAMGSGGPGGPGGGSSLDLDRIKQIYQAQRGGGR